MVPMPMKPRRFQLLVVGLLLSLQSTGACHYERAGLSGRRVSYFGPSAWFQSVPGAVERLSTGAGLREALRGFFFSSDPVRSAVAPRSARLDFAELDKGVERSRTVPPRSAEAATPWDAPRVLGRRRFRRPEPPTHPPPVVPFHLDSKK